MKDNNLLLNNEIDSEFSMLISNRNQFFKVEGKKRILQTVRSAIVSRKIAISCSDGCFMYWNQINQIIWSFLPHCFKHTT